MILRNGKNEREREKICYWPCKKCAVMHSNGERDAFIGNADISRIHCERLRGRTLSRRRAERLERNFISAKLRFDLSSTADGRRSPWRDRCTLRLRSTTPDAIPLPVI